MDGLQSITGISFESFLMDRFPDSGEIREWRPKSVKWEMHQGSGRSQKIDIALDGDLHEFSVAENYRDIGYSGRFSRMTYPEGMNGNNTVPAVDEDILGMVLAAKIGAPSGVFDFVHSEALAELEERAKRLAGILSVVQSQAI